MKVCFLILFREVAGLSGPEAAISRALSLFILSISNIRSELLCTLYFQSALEKNCNKKQLTTNKRSRNMGNIFCDESMFADICLRVTGKCLTLFLLRLLIMPNSRADDAAHGEQESN